MDTRESTTELLRAYYEAFNHADGGHVLSLLSEDATHDVDEGCRERSREALPLFMERPDLCYAGRIRDMRVMVDSKNTRTSGESIVGGVYKTTNSGLLEAHGRTDSRPGGAFIEIRAGKVAPLTNHDTLTVWLERVTG